MRHLTRFILAIPVAAIMGLSLAVPAYSESHQVSSHVSGFAKPHPKLTNAMITRMSPRRVDALFTPLRRVANAVDQVGRTRAADIYSGLALNGPDGTVDVYLTDTSKASWLLAAAHKLDRKADMGRVRIHHGAFTKKALDAATAYLWAESQAHKLPYRIWMTSVSHEGTGIVIGVSNVKAARQDAGRVAKSLQRLAASPKPATSAIKLSFHHANHPARPLYNKYDDTSGQIGGDQLYGQENTGTCTAGFAAHDSAGNDFLITAGHCYPNNEDVETYHSHTWIGYVFRGPYTYFDSDLIYQGLGHTFYNDEGEGTTPSTSRYYPLSDGHAYSYYGDYVYQNGVTSSYYAGWTPSNIMVINQDTTWNGGEGTVRGVIGRRQGDNRCVGYPGDSGATVFSLNPDGKRQLRGIVDVGVTEPGSHTCYLNAYGGVLAGSTDIGWVEATDILNHWGLTQDTWT